MERLDKYISSQTGLSRSQARDRILKGAVSVNGEKTRAIDRKIEPETDKVLLDGSEVGYVSFLYIMLNKPKGYVSATRDRDEKTVMELLPEKWRRTGMFPAGRLDKDTQGLLILTDDGELGHRITAPGRHVQKTYRALLDSPSDGDMIDRFARGIELGDGEKCKPAILEPCGEQTGCEVLIRISEGKYHQVKRMCAACGRKVLELKRLQIGGLKLDPELKAGECRSIEKAELVELFKSDSETLIK